jgi:hypothetical protein
VRGLRLQPSPAVPSRRRKTLARDVLCLASAESEGIMIQKRILAAAWISLVAVPAAAAEALPSDASAEAPVAVEQKADPAAGARAESGSPSDPDDTGAAPPLFSSVRHVGGYGGPSVMYSRIAGRDGVLVGGEGAVLIDHRLALGGAGYGWTRDASGPADVDGVPRDLRVGYGGFLVRYSILTSSLVYGSLGGLVGAGAATLHRNTEDEQRADARADATDAFFVFEPQLSIQINLLRWMRVGVQGGYRITSGVGGLGYRERDIDGMTLGGTLQFGRL